LNRLVDQGNSVIIIEHNLEVIRVVDWVIDLGPEAGQAGGQIVFEGSPQMLIDYARSTMAQGVPKGRHRSYTGEALAQWESVRTAQPGLVRESKLTTAPMSKPRVGTKRKSPK
jgi:hypothetical protein